MTESTDTNANANVGETDVSAGNWQAAVEFYAKALGAAMPSNLDVSPLVLERPDFTLRLHKVDEDKEWMTPKPKNYTRVKGPMPFDIVTRVYNSLLNSDPTAFSIAEPHYVPGPGNSFIILALVGFGDPCFDKDVLSKIEGVIHNPNW